MMTVRDFWLRDGMGRLEDKSNNFTAMRILFALMVLYAHALIIPQGLPYVGAWQVTADFLVNCALDGFFILSGYMITASAMKSTSLTGYAASRIFRNARIPSERSTGIQPVLVKNSPIIGSRSNSTFSTKAGACSSQLKMMVSHAD